jgi:O-antigen ligase
MKTDFFNQRNTIFRQIIFVGIVCFIACFVGYYSASRSLVDRLLGDKVNVALLDYADTSNILVLVIRRVLILGVMGISALLGVWAVYKKKYEMLLFGFILTFPFAHTLNSFFFTLIYVDSLGPTSNYLGLTNCLLLLSLFMLIIRESNLIRQAFSKAIPWCFVALFFAGFLTQSYHLGIVNGLIIGYVRIMQPLIFIILVSHVARTKPGLRKIMIVLVVTIAITIFYRIISPSTLVTDPVYQRVGGLGSWTIYGTLLVASIPLAIVLWVTTPKLKLFIVGLIPLTVYEAYLTQTRGAIVALGALGLFAFEKRFRFLIIPLLLAVIWILSSPDPITIQLTGNRLLSLDARVMSNDINWGVRIERNLSALRYIETHPFTGLGLGQPSSETGSQLAFWVYNPYLHWGVAMGIPAMLAFAYMMLQSIFNAIRNFTSETGENKIYQFGILIALTVWVINQFTTGDSLTYLSVPEATLMFYAVIGLILGQQIERESKLVHKRENP